MNAEHTMMTILNGHGFNILDYPFDGAEGIGEPGFYFNQAALCIEHWSLPCIWNLPFQDHNTNGLGIVRDGWQSIVDCNDAEHLISTVKNWLEYLKRENVES